MEERRRGPAAGLMEASETQHRGPSRGPFLNRLKKRFIQANNVIRALCAASEESGEAPHEARLHGY